MVRLKGKKKDQDQSMGDLVIASSDEEEEQEEAGAGGGEPEPQNAEEVVRVIAVRAVIPTFQITASPSKYHRQVGVHTITRLCLVCDACRMKTVK
jgi:hypothetical protein